MGKKFVLHAGKKWLMKQNPKGDTLVVSVMVEVRQKSSLCREHWQGMELRGRGKAQSGLAWV